MKKFLGYTIIWFWVTLLLWAILVVHHQDFLLEDILAVTIVTTALAACIWSIVFAWKLMDE